MHLDNIEKDSSLVIFDWNAIMNQTQPDPLRVLNSVYAFVKQLHCELYIILGPEDVAQKMGFQLQCETRMESIPLMDAFAQIEATPETMIVLGKQRDFSRVYELLSPKASTWHMSYWIRMISHLFLPFLTGLFIRNIFSICSMHGLGGELNPSAQVSRPSPIKRRLP